MFKNKIKKKYYAIGFLVMYIAGYFVMPPIYMYSLESQLYPLIRTTQATSNTLYWSWIGLLHKDNHIRKAWNKNSRYWCEQVKACTVK